MDEPAQLTTFDALFDDVYQVPRFASAMGLSGPTCSLDLRARLGLAAILGESILVPVTLLIDHNPLWELLDDDEWADCIFGHGLLKPACSNFDVTYDDVYQHLCRTSPELTSHPTESARVKDAAPSDRASVFDAEHGPWLKPRFDRLSAKAEITNPTKTYRWSPGSVYGPILKTLAVRALKRSPFDRSYRVFHDRLGEERDLDGLNRTGALTIVDSLETEGAISPTEASTLSSLAIHAKCEEMRAALRTDLLGIVASPKEEGDPEWHTLHATECPNSGRVAVG